VLWLAITGILLNHSDDLGLDEKAVKPSWLNQLYGLESTPVSSGYKLGQGWLVTLPGAYYVNGRLIVADYGPLVGAVLLKNEALLVTSESVVVLDQQGEVLEIQGAFNEALCRVHCEHGSGRSGYS